MSEPSEPKVIKRYQNRKLYDTTDSCYVTLEDISDMIKMGDEVRILDNRTQEDITAMTLAQIIFEEQKRKTNIMPLGVFTQLIRNSGEAIKHLLTKTIENSQHVREFVDETLKPTMEGVQSLPHLHHEMKDLKQKLTALEEKIKKRL